jgi:hypothetical protein
VSQLGDVHLLSCTAETPQKECAQHKKDKAVGSSGLAQRKNTVERTELARSFSVLAIKKENSHNNSKQRITLELFFLPSLSPPLCLLAIVGGEGVFS